MRGRIGYTYDPGPPQVQGPEAGTRLRMLGADGADLGVFVVGGPDGDGWSTLTPADDASEA